MKFKIGDKVRVRKDLFMCKDYYMENSDTFDKATEDMLDLRGKIVTISAYSGLNNRKYKVVEDNHIRNWVDEMFETIAIKETQTINSIVERVLVNDSATIVFFTDKTKQVVKLAKGDTFDIEKAVAIAVAKHVLGGYTGLENVIEKVESKGFVPIGRAVIENSGALYSTLLPTFFKKNGIEKYTKSYLRASNGFMYDYSELLARGTEVEILHRVKNHFNVIRPVGSDKVYVIGDGGIEII